VVALSAAVRQVESRDVQLLNGPLAQSGSIEHDADVVLFVIARRYYLQNKNPSPARRT